MQRFFISILLAKWRFYILETSAFDAKEEVHHSSGNEFQNFWITLEWPRGSMHLWDDFALTGSMIEIWEAWVENRCWLAARSEQDLGEAFMSCLLCFALYQLWTNLLRSTSFPPLEGLDIWMHGMVWMIVHNPGTCLAQCPIDSLGKSICLI